jgi:hypothetical protein
MLRNAYAQLIDFTDLEGIIESNTKFLPSDLDMIYERKGKFLIGEWKKDGEKVSNGQEILLKALAKTPNFIVLLITGFSEDTKLFVKKIQIIDKNGELQTKYEYDDLFGDKQEDGVIMLKEMINTWYKWADNVQKF